MKRTRAIEVRSQLDECYLYRLSTQGVVALVVAVAGISVALLVAAWGSPLLAYAVLLLAGVGLEEVAIPRRYLFTVDGVYYQMRLPLRWMHRGALLVSRADVTSWSRTTWQEHPVLIVHRRGGSPLRLCYPNRSCGGEAERAAIEWLRETVRNRGSSDD